MADLMFDNNEQIKRALTTLAIEKALLDVGKGTYDKVLDLLSAEYNCYLPDCYDHPEYLAEILQKFYGKAGNAIVELITIQLEEFNYHSSIKKFLQVICN